MTLSLIPEPKRLTLNKGSFELPAMVQIGIGDRELYPAARVAGEFLPRTAVNIAVHGAAADAGAKIPDPSDNANTAPMARTDSGDNTRAATRDRSRARGRPCPVRSTGGFRAPAAGGR